MTPDASEPTSLTLACSHCGRTIELCAFCDRERCGVASCNTCLRLALGEAMAEPHAHGG